MPRQLHSFSKPAYPRKEINKLHFLSPLSNWFLLYCWHIWIREWHPSCHIWIIPFFVSINNPPFPVVLPGLYCIRKCYRIATYPGNISRQHIPETVTRTGTSSSGNRSVTGIHLFSVIFLPSHMLSGCCLHSARHPWQALPVPNIQGSCHSNLFAHQRRHTPYRLHILQNAFYTTYHLLNLLSKSAYLLALSTNQSQARCILNCTILQCFFSHHSP